MSKLILIDDFVPKDEYELDEIVQNDRGLTIKFNGVIHRIIAGIPYLNGGNQEEGQAEKDCRSGCFI